MLVTGRTVRITGGEGEDNMTNAWPFGTAGRTVRITGGEGEDNMTNAWPFGTGSRTARIAEGKKVRIMWCMHFFPGVE